MKAEKRKWFLPKPFLIAAIACLVAASVFFALACTVSAGMYDQRAAQLWQGYNPEAMRYAQVSAFLARGSGLSYDRYGQLCYNLDEKLAEDSLGSDSESSRLWISAASTDGTVTAARGSTSLGVTATAVTGDFFLFHQPELMSGSYLRSDEIAKDIVLLDWDTAWRLFGGFNVTDMELTVGGVRVVVGGVFRKNADDTSAYRIYMSYELYERINPSSELTVLEFVLPNQVSDYAFNAVSKEITAAEANRVIVENSTRFELGELFAAVKNIRETIAQTKSIALPFWENTARVAQLRGAVFLLLAMISAVLPAVAVLWVIAKIYKKRSAFVPWVRKLPTTLKGRFSRKDAKIKDRENAISGGQTNEVPNENEKDDGIAAHSGDDNESVRVQTGGD